MHEGAVSGINFRPKYPPTAWVIGLVESDKKHFGTYWNGHATKN